MNFSTSTKHGDTLKELEKYVQQYPFDPDTNYMLNQWTKLRMRQIREFYGVPKTVLAHAIDTSYHQYLRFESGNSKVPVYVVSSLALFYNLSLDFICGMSNTPTPLYEKEPIPVNGAWLPLYWGTVTPNED